MNQILTNVARAGTVNALRGKGRIMKVFFLLLATLAYADEFDPYLGQAAVREAILAACFETGVPIHVAAGLQFSEFKPHDRAKDTGRCRGWWQLDTKYHDYYRDTFNGGREFDEYDPVASTFVAVRYLAHLYKKRGTWWGSLVDFKHGPNAKEPAALWIVQLCRAIENGNERWWR